MGSRVPIGSSGLNLGVSAVDNELGADGSCACARCVTLTEICGAAPPAWQLDSASGPGRGG